jgi:hypothetical protein
MSFEDVLGKLSSHIYEAIDEFEADLTLIWTNSMTYNKADTPYYRAAHKLQNLAKTLLPQAHIDFDCLELNNNGILNYEIDPDLFSYNTDLSVEPTALEENKENQQETNETETSEKKEDVAEKDVKADEKVEKTKKVENKKPKSRVTRSNTERNKRTLRSRSITKDTSQPVKIRRTTEKEFDKTSHDVTKEQQESPKELPKESPKESPKQASESVEPEGSVQSDKSVQSEKSEISDKSDESDESDKSAQTKTSAPVKKLRSNTPKLKYEDGEIVWARVVGFPPHPATVSLHEMNSNDDDFLKKNIAC